LIYLFVELQPRGVALTVRVLEAEEPNFTQADRLDHLIKQLLASGRRLDGKLQLRIHRRHTYIHLQHNQQMNETIRT
jgi:hypothetical protein